MDEILGDIPRVFVYIDDILVASESPEQHLKDLELVFKTLSANGMVVQRPKCVLGVTSLEFLGYQVDSTGISPLKDRVKAIEETTPPTSVKELQRFLGMVGYYRRFMPNAAKHLFHLFEALKGKPKTLEWTADCQKSFEATKSALAAATLLHHPRPGAPLSLTTDASNTAIGGVLEQRGPRGWEPLAFWSAKLEPNQMMWPPYDRELLAAFRGTRHFRSWIEGRPFTLFTDHQSLVPSIHKKTDPQTLRQTYQLSCVAEYTTDVRYIEGKSNVVADALSRPNEEIVNVNSINEAATSPRQEEWSTTASFDRQPHTYAPIFRKLQTATSSTTSPPTASAKHQAASTAKAEAAFTDLNCVVNAIGDLGLNWDDIATQQTLDPEFRRLRQEARSGLNFRAVDIGNKSIIVDLSNGPARPYIPFAARRKVFDCFHGLGHPGVERTRQAISEKVVWPSMRADISKWARECLACQQAKVTRHTVPPIGDFKVPNKRFEHINMDIVTLPLSNGFKYLLTMVDRFTRWPVAVPLVDMTVQSVVDAFAYGWVQQFGVPSTLTTDRGTQFTSTIFTQLAKIWGINLITTTSYHPEANGLVERLHRRLKEALIALGAESTDEWFWKLPCVMLSIRTTLKPDVGASPADLVYGEGLAVPGELLPSNPATDVELLRQRAAALSDMRLEVARLQPVQTSAHQRPLVHLPDNLNTCTHVFVRRGGILTSLASPYVGPFRVVSRNHTNFKVAIPGRQDETVAISRVKPAYCSVRDAEDAEPPPRPPVGRRRNRRVSNGHEDPPHPPPAAPQPQPPPIRRRIPRGRPRPLPNEDEPQPQPQPQPVHNPADYPLDYEVPVDDIPVWEPPAWFDLDPQRDWDAEPEAEAPPAPPTPTPAPRQELFRDRDSEPEVEAPLTPDPPPLPQRRKKRKPGNPNWVKGGTFEGSWTRGRPRPDVSAIYAHLGISPSSPHLCSTNCEVGNSPL